MRQGCAAKFRINNFFVSELVLLLVVQFLLIDY